MPFTSYLKEILINRRILKGVNFLKLSYLEYLGIIQSNLIVLDYCHKNQNGYTMRFIESYVNGNVILTNNKNILEDQSLDHSGIFYFETINDVINILISLDEKAFYLRNDCDKFLLSNWVKSLMIK